MKRLLPFIAILLFALATSTLSLGQATNAEKLLNKVPQGLLNEYLVREVRQEVHKLGSEPLIKQYRIWTDPTTGLLWSSHDNGTDVNWDQANNYCQNLMLAGYLNWRLPTIDELEGIYDRTKNVSGYHIKGRIDLSGAPWSGSLGRSDSQAWSFYFGRGMRYSFPRLFSLDRRALCVCDCQD